MSATFTFDIKEGYIVKDSGSGAKLRGYVIVSDSTHKEIFYAAEVSGTYAELSANE